MTHRRVHWTRRSALLAAAAAHRGARRRNRLRGENLAATPFGPLRVDLSVDLDSIDPALAYGIDELAARVRDLREARQLPRRDAAGGIASSAGDRGGDADDLAGRTDVHVPDPKRLRVLAACNGRRHRPEHEVHVRANGASGHAIPGLVLLRQHRRDARVPQRAAERDRRHRRRRKHADDLAHRAAMGSS